MTQTRLIGVGAFVLVGLLLFATALFLIGNRRMLFMKRFVVYAQFAKITGLQAGAPVRVAGMDAGEVEEIVVPPNPSTPFRVRLRVREDLHQLVRTDSVATIQTDGIVGNRFVQVDTGSAQAPQAPEGSTIQSKEPFGMAELLEEASGAIKSVEKTILDVKTDLEITLGNLADLAGQARDVVADVGDDVKAITTHGRAITDDLQVVMRNVREGRGTVGQLVNNDELYKKIDAIAGEAKVTAQRVRETVEEARKAIDKVNDKKGGAGEVIADLRQTVGLAREAMTDLAENSESLKRSFFFRGMFRERGFYDLDLVSFDAYRSGEFAGKGREPIRIWLDAAVLFTTDPEGLDVLTPDGRRRLDSAMTTFLRYPRNTPLVVEGYSTGDLGDAQYLRSRTRAMLVREYLVRRFGLNGNAVGLMPLGGQADGSPRSDGRWDGVGLALWMKRDQFLPAPPTADVAPRGAPAPSRP